MIALMTITRTQETNTQLSNAAIRAGVYVRISMDREGAGLGVQRQEEDCRAYCERRGWPVVDVYVDNDVSASSSKPRPEWQRLLADIEAGRINAIAVWHVDRMTRKPRELEDVIDMHEKQGTQLGTVTGDIDLATPTGRMIARMLGAAARHEAEHKGERQRRQRMQAAQSGKPHKTGRRPFGYMGDFVTPHAVEAPYFIEAARRVLAGESLISVSKWLNEEGVTTSAGNPWTYSALRSTLIRARYSGRREVGATSTQRLGEIVAVDCWAPLITDEQSDRLRSMLVRPKSTTHTTTIKHLLSGLLTCNECGASMAGGPKRRGVPQYRCNRLSRRASEQGGCGRVLVTMRHADELVVGMVLDAIDSPELARRMADTTELDSSVAEQITRDEQELIDIARDRAEGAITRGEWVTMRETIDARLQANRQLVQSVSKTNALSLLDGEGELREKWDRLNVGQQRAIISALLDELRVSSSRGGRQPDGSYFDPSRFAPKWRV